VLKRLVQLVGEGQRPVTLHELAGRLGGISIGLVEQMVEQLVHLGYLQVAAPRCGGTTTCRACDEAGTCSMLRQPRLWVLTDRGQRLARASIFPRRSERL